MDYQITEERRDDLPPSIEDWGEYYLILIPVSSSRTSFSRERYETAMQLIGGRNLVLCIDGTANQFGKKNTNVIELYNLVMKDTGHNQYTWYNSGIGTYARPHWASFKYRKQVVVHTVDLTIAWNFDKTILAAYEWLADNYQDGDCIFLFGFSRGAFQVRVLSAMIDKVGLIYKGNEKQIPFAYELYADPKTDLPEDEEAQSSMLERLKQALGLAKKKETEDQPGQGVEQAELSKVEHSGQAETETQKREAKSMAGRFKRAFSRSNVKVHFVGAWDTVSSIGVVRGKRMLPRTVEGMAHVCYFRHALALDERRVKFQPEYAWGGTTLPPPGMMVKELNTEAGLFPHTLEVWFAGTHSDIGGGNVKNAGMDRSRPPSRWMASEAEALGLRLKPFKRELLASEQIEFQESLKGFWHLFELLPFRRLTFARSTGAKPDTFVPHLWSARKIHAGQKIHSSLVLAELKTSYIPKARPPPQKAAGGNSGADPDGGGLFRSLRRLRQTGTPHPGLGDAFWKDLRLDELTNSNGWLEVDLVDHTRLLLKRLVDGTDVKAALTELVSKYHAAQTVYDETREAVRHATTVAVECQLYYTAIEILEGHRRNLKFDKQDPFIRVLCSRTDDEYQAAKQFLRRITATSRDGAQAVYDETVEAILLWKENPPELGAQYGVLLTAIVVLEGDLESLKLRMWREIWNALADRRSTNDHQDVVKRFLNRFTTDGNCLFELRGHTNHVNAVAISPDSKHIVSVASEGIRIWDLETGAQVGGPLRGHTSSVKGVAISPDGKRIVSCSQDKTIRIWDAATGAQVGEPLLGHENTVWSVAISPDGKRIVSGSSDSTIRIWDLETGAQVGEPLRGHTNKVASVAISPDGKHIVSGSRDNTIRVWDAETGAQVGELLRGHKNTVLSVAISPDGDALSPALATRRFGSGMRRRGHRWESRYEGTQIRTIRIWDLETGAKVGKPLRGHTDWVRSVAISPDGKQIVSGSFDHTIRIWSAEGILV
ncbi:hypothetical protein EST38_g9574 [Candolleomyces aberdarensis]|uniref:T6SS Phospholipase effector Tle1-like catalytic domain-containing protein n=1 Tax=Candolleomyces aberdarensis TaxID=2316362 RepID=A0A4Q2DBW7_9AGAR|nr:hypothetical protein EST38_g9574 [Candolleomyces aberdarensis]